MTLQWQRFKTWNTLWLLLYALFVFDITSYVFQHPRYNWDLLPYAASAVSISAPTEKVSERTFDTLRSEMRPRLFNRGYYQPKGVYGSTIAREPDALRQQLPFYQVKPLYVGSIWLMHQLGMPLTFSMQLINVASLLAVAALLALFRPAVLWMPVWLAGSAYMIFRTHMSAQLFTPDYFSTALALGACYAGIIKQRVKIAATLFAAAILARPDMAPAAGIFFVLLGWASPDIGWRVTGYCLAGCVLAYLLAAAPGYGWKTTFQHAFMGKLIYPETADPLFQWNAYKRITLRFIKQLLDHGNPLFLMPVLAIPAGIVALCKRSWGTPINLMGALGIVAGGAFIIKVLIFPMAGIRFHVFAVMASWVALGWLVGTLMASKTRSLQPELE